MSSIIYGAAPTPRLDERKFGPQMTPTFRGALASDEQTQRTGAVGEREEVRASDSRCAALRAARHRPPIAEDAEHSRVEFTRWVLP